MGDPPTTTTTTTIPIPLARRGRGGFGFLVFLGFLGCLGQGGRRGACHPAAVAVQRTVHARVRGRRGAGASGGAGVDAAAANRISKKQTLSKALGFKRHDAGAMRNGSEKQPLPKQD